MVKKIVTLNIYILGFIFITPIIVLILLRTINNNDPLLTTNLNYMYNSCFFSITFFLIFIWQYIVGILYYKEINQKSILFYFNGIIAILFLVYLIYIQSTGLLEFLDKKDSILEGLKQKQNAGPIRLSRANYIFLLFLTHSALTFIFNVIFMSNSYIKIEDNSIKNKLKLQYIKPIKIITWSTVISFSVYFIVSLVIDLVTLLK